MRIVVTGATGTIGGQRVPALLAAGHSVRILVRNPAGLADKPWAANVGVAVGDILDRDDPYWYLLVPVYMRTSSAPLANAIAREAEESR
jgi:nucleoside-diphosphate-sugar epimerase